MSVTKQLMDLIDFHSRKKMYYGSQWLQLTVWLLTFFKISIFLCSRRKKFIQFWNNLRVSKWWQNFHFEVNYFFKCPKPGPLSPSIVIIPPFTHTELLRGTQGFKINKSCFHLWCLPWWTKQVRIIIFRWSELIFCKNPNANGKIWLGFCWGNQADATSRMARHHCSI